MREKANDTANDADVDDYDQLNDVDDADADDYDQIENEW